MNENSNEPARMSPEARAEIARMARELAPFAGTESALYIAHGPDGQVFSIGYIPGIPAMHGPQLPEIEDVIAAQAANNDTALNGTQEQAARALAELDATEAGFTINAEREIERLTADLEAGQ